MRFSCIYAAVVTPDDADHSNLDEEEYLPPATLRWCEQTVLSAGFTSAINASLDDLEARAAFLYLRDCARRHIRERRQPELQESRKLYNGRQLVPSQATQEIFAQAGEPILQEGLGEVDQEELEVNDMDDLWLI